MVFAEWASAVCKERRRKLYVLGSVEGDPEGDIRFHPERRAQMRRWIKEATETLSVLSILLLAISLIAYLCGVAGCGGKGSDDARSSGGEGDYEAVEEGQRISVRREPPPLEEIGLPLYPGSVYVEGSGGSYVAGGDQGYFESKSLAYRTGDPFDKVVDWYRERLGDPTAEYHAENERSAHWTVNQGEGVTLFLSLRASLREAEGTVLIEMGRLSGSLRP